MKNLTYRINSPYTFINFLRKIQPTGLFHPTRLFGTLEYLDKLVSKLIWKTKVKCTDLKGTYSWSCCSQRTKFAVERVGNDNCLDSLALLNVLTIFRHFFWLIFLYRVKSLQTYDVCMNSSRNIKILKLKSVFFIFFCQICLQFHQQNKILILGKLTKSYISSTLLINST